METNRLVTGFDSFVTAIIDHLKVSVGRQGFTQNAEAIDGHTLEDLLDMVRDSLHLHVNEPNVHNLTWQQLGGLSRQTIMGIMGSVQISTIIPISTVSLKTYDAYEIDWDEGTLELPGFVYTFNGTRRNFYKFELIDIPPDAVSVLVLNVDPEPTVDIFGTHALDYLSIESHVYPDMYKIPVGRVDSKTNTLNLYDVVKIGEYTLSKIARGASIPISTQLSEFTGSLAPEWKL